MITKNPMQFKAIIKSKELQNFWIKYSNEYEYAKNLDFHKICDLILEILNLLPLKI